MCVCVCVCVCVYVCVYMRVRVCVYVGQELMGDLERDRNLDRYEPYLKTASSISDEANEKQDS